MKKEKIKFYLPGFYEHIGLNRFLFDLMREHPEYFYDNIEIGAVFGCFPGNIWNGGRTVLGFSDIHLIRDIIKEYDYLQIPMRFTWTNVLLTEEHYKNPICNTIMELADNGINEVLVSEDNFEQYIRKTYPNYKIISSTTKCILTEKELNEELNKDYDLVVLDHRLNHNFELLDKIERKDKIEFLINPRCSPQCPNRKAHYLWESKNQIAGMEVVPPVNYNQNYKCPGYDFYNNKNLETISNEELYNLYYHKGFFNFKIEGRTIHPLDVIENYIYYMVKPEFKDYIKYLFIKNCSNWR